MILFYNDIDKTVVRGRKSIGTMEDAQQKSAMSIGVLFKNNRLFMGTVSLVRDKVQMVDVEYGKPSKKGIPHKVYRYCKVLQWNGVNANKEYWGSAHLPEVGTEVVCGFLNNMEEHPVVLGCLITKNSESTLNLLKSKDVAKNIYGQLGKVKWWIKADGTIEIENDNAKVTISVSGDVKVDGTSVNMNNGSKGVARKDDTVTLNLSGVDIQTLATALLATGGFMPSGSPPSPAPTPVMLTDGKITSSSGTVKAGN